MNAPIYRGYSTISKSGVNTKINDIELVKADLLNHFETRLGERVGRPEFGSIIHDLHFDLFDDRTEQLVYQDVFRVIRTDPRVVAKKVEVNVNQDTHTIKVNVLLTYIEFNMDDWFSYTFSFE